MNICFEKKIIAESIFYPEPDTCLTVFKWKCQQG